MTLANVINKTHIHEPAVPATRSAISGPDPPTLDVKYEVEPVTPATRSTVPNKPPPLRIKLEVEQRFIKREPSSPLLHRLPRLQELESPPIYHPAISCLPPSSPVSRPPNHLRSSSFVSHSNDNDNDKHHERNEVTLVNGTPDGSPGDDRATVGDLTMLVTASEKTVIEAIRSYVDERLASHRLETASQDLYIDVLRTCLITADLGVPEPPILESQQQFLYP
ncbi:hypothetical protein GYMLUDRAFT_51584 [Collybiopsis luxurians FD-317 M1]|uniref:Uncharacterized protein n=1 Tax=Collybiopsis luxurians FD-317 M1 TaxID=944289 RepID=A0A0D0BJJ9_9AGAR|nr:hypothetical protein GYMLUDRAFT_51584 [Collybiopsis luxurians FD-317 M1]